MYAGMFVYVCPYVRRPRSACLEGKIKRQGYPREETPTPTPPPLDRRYSRSVNPLGFPCAVYEAHIYRHYSRSVNPLGFLCAVYEAHTENQED